MKYRILYHHRIRADDGQAVHVREMIGALRAAGHHVVECALVPKADGAEGQAAGWRARLWQKLALPRNATECAEILYSRKGRAMLRKATRGFRPDFVYERYALHCDAGLSVAKWLGIPLLLEVNSPLCDEMEALGELRFPRRARRTEAAVLAGADRVLPVSAALARRLVDLGAPEDRIRVVRNGGVPEWLEGAAGEDMTAVREQLQIPEDCLLLGFTGFVRTWHRVDLVLEAMRDLNEERVHLLLIGDGPDRAALVARAGEMGIGHRLHVTGSVPRATVAGMLTMVDIAVLPAINDYASPLKLFDYLAAGIPVVAVDQPNIRELIHDGSSGMLFRPGDAQDLARKLRALLADQSLSKSVGAAGLEALIANEWTWEGNAQRVIEAFEELL